MEAGTGALLEDTYQSKQTNWDSVNKFAAWGDRLEAVLGRFLSIDQPDLHAKLSQTVRQLVGPR